MSCRTLKMIVAVGLCFGLCACEEEVSEDIGRLVPNSDSEEGSEAGGKLEAASVLGKLEKKDPNSTGASVAAGIGGPEEVALAEAAPVEVAKPIDKEALKAKEEAIAKATDEAPKEEQVFPGHFAISSALPSRVDQKVAKKLAKDYALCPEKIMVTGHTDHFGSGAQNTTLSDDRARAVAKFLVQNGIKFERLTLQQAGDTRPMGPNDTKEGRAANRRVTVECIR